MNTRYSISISSAVGNHRSKMDFEEGQIPHITGYEFVGRREVRSSRHKRSTGPLSLEYLLRKCREKNERIIHIQEQITN